MVVLFCFYQLYTNQSHLKRENFSWGSVSIRLACGSVCGTFSWLLIDVGESPDHSDPCGPILFNKTISKKHCSMVPASRFLSRVPSLASLDDWLHNLNDEINPFLLKLPLAVVFTQQQKPNSDNDSATTDHHIARKPPGSWQEACDRFLPQTWEGLIDPIITVTSA